MLLLTDQLEHHLKCWEDDYENTSDMDLFVLDETGEKTPGLSSSNIPERLTTAVSNLISKLRICSIRDSCIEFQTMLLLPFGGFLLGIYYQSCTYILCRSTAVSHGLGIVVAAILGSCAVSVSWNKAQYAYSSRRLAHRNALRCKLVSLLSSISAPPPSTTDMKTMLSKNNADVVLQEIIHLVLSFTELLATIDSALGRLKSATSMALGLGIWSPAVTRVEHNQSNRSVLVSAKKVLALGLQHGLELFHTNRRKIKVTDTIVSLSWLYSERQNLIIALVDYIVVESNVAHLRDCRDNVEELNVYITSSLFECRKEQISPLHLVAQHLHAAEIALWAFTQDNCQESVGNVWIEQFLELLKVASNLQHTVKPNDAQELSPEIVSELGETSPSGADSSPLDFEHGGDRNGASRSLNCPQDPPQHATLVFSGKGQVQIKQPQHRNVGFSASESVPTAAIVAQSMLLRELQARLSTMNSPDEIHVKDLDSNGEELDVCAHDFVATSTDFIISGSLLAELESSIRDQNRGIEYLGD